MLQLEAKNTLRLDATDGQQSRRSKIWYDSASRPDVVGYDFFGEDFDLYQDFSLNPAGQIGGLDISNPLYHFDDTGTTLGNYVPNGLNQYQSAKAKTFAYDKNGNQTRDERRIYMTWKIVLFWLVVT